MQNPVVDAGWNLLVGKAKEIWGDKVTDEMVEGAKNNADQLMLALQNKFGETSAVIKQKLDQLKN